LAVSSEAVVYSTVTSFISHNQLKQEEITALFEAVRFPFLSKEQLKEAESNPLVPKELLIEARDPVPTDYIEDISSSLEGPSRRLTIRWEWRTIPRQAYSISLEYSSDFDDKGVFYHIGTKGHTDNWTNPALRGRVRVQCSSSAKGNIMCLLERAPTEFWTNDVPASWVQVSLGSTRTLIPNFYTLRHGGLNVTYR